MLEKRRRITGLAALSLTAVGAVAGMEGAAYPTAKEPRPAVTGGGWLTDSLGARLHFALSAHEQDSGDFGHLNVRLEGNEGAFWGDVTSVQIASDRAEIEGVVRKATGAYAACEGESFNATAQDGGDGREADGLEGGCAGGPRFASPVEQGEVQVKP